MTLVRVHFEVADHESVGEASIAQALSLWATGKGNKPVEWLDQQMKGGRFSAEAHEIVRNNVKYLRSPSWMGLYAQLRSQEDRFQVLMKAVEPVEAGLVTGSFF